MFHVEQYIMLAQSIDQCFTWNKAVVYSKLNQCIEDQMHSFEFGTVPHIISELNAAVRLGTIVAEYFP